jgi:hypothetical protein
MADTEPITNVTPLRKSDPANVERPRRHRSRKRRKQSSAMLTFTPGIAATVASEPVATAPPARNGAVRAERATAANLAAYLAAVSLAGVAAYFSVGGMAEIFAGATVAVMVLAATMEAAKLVIAGWLARHWQFTGWRLRTVLIVLVAGLALINAAGVYGRLVEAHVGVMVAATSSVAERTGAMDARTDAQAKTVAQLDQRIDEIGAVIAKMTERGRTKAALDAIAGQQKVRDNLVANRQKEATALVELRGERAALDGEHQRIEAARGPIVYLAAMAGVEVETAIRWLILLMVLTCDPTAIALTVAASRR